MKIGLIGTYSSPEAVGLRFISSFLKSHNHQVKLIFLTTKRTDKSWQGYKRELIEQLIEHLKECNLIGLSLMTNTYHQACFLTERLKSAKIDAPIIWGGVHPTVSPDSCIKFADIVCVGEGEDAIADLACALQESRNFTKIENLWVRWNGQIYRNQVRPLREDLDSIPFPDYELAGRQFIVSRGRIVEANPKNMRGALKRYRLLTTRGCPYACTFCCNSTWLKIYRGKGHWVRKRSIEKIIDELSYMKSKFKTINSISIIDDTFFVRTEQEFEDFAKLYREKIALPFEINTHPATINRRKIEILHSCGCALVKMGIQSGSEKTNFEIFKRRVPNEQTIKAMEILNEFPLLQKEYHYIVCNPFEPDEQMIETLHFAAEHHRGNFKVLIFPLALFPGSQLHQWAKERNIIQGEQEEIYERVYTGKAKRSFTRLGYLVMLLQAVVNMRRLNIPSNWIHKFIDFMTARPVRFCLDRIWFKSLVFGIYLVGRSVRRIIYQLFFRPFRKHRRKYSLNPELVPPAR